MILKSTITKEIIYLPAIKTYFDRLVDLLDQAGLCTDDLETMNGLLMVAVYADEGVTDDLIGGFGIENCHEDGLLRSMIIRQDHRGKRLGSQLLDEAKTYARVMGLKRLYLLTTTASSFFAGHGFAEISRKSVPKAVGETMEFKTFCPDSAVCMVLEMN